MSTLGRVARRSASLGLVAAVAFASACGGSSTTSPTTPGSVTPPTTEVFTGVLPVGGSAFHPFTIALSNGQVSATLTAAGPPSTVSLGLGVGTPNGSACSLFSGSSVIAQASTTAHITGTADAGSYCVSIFDVGNQSTDVTYTVRVTHY